MRRPGRDRAADHAGRRRARRITVADGERATSPPTRSGTIVTRPERTPDKEPPVVVRSGIWYRAILSAEQIAAGGLSALCEQFAVTVREAGEPAGACLFAITDLAGDGQQAPAETESTAIFFSPIAISVVPTMLARCNARPSAAPDRDRAALLVGRPLDWDLLPRTTH